MKKLNVKCESCKVGKLVVIGTDDIYYKMGCNICDTRFLASPIAHSALIAYSNQNDVEGDISTLYDNGNWFFTTQFQKGFDLDEYTKSMTKIHTIDDGMEKVYYELDGRFFRFSTYYDGAIAMHYLEPHGVSALYTIINHFYDLKYNTLHTKEEQF